MTPARADPPSSDELEVSVFGPSKGECIVVHVPHGPWFVVDSFRVRGCGLDEPVAVVYLRDVIQTTDVYGLFLTHWHDDHTAGAGDVIRAFARSLRMVGLPDVYGKRELGSFIADRLPDGLRGAMIKDLVDVTSALKSPSADAIETRLLAAGMVLSPPGNGGWTLEALSPSVEDTRYHFNTMMSYLPDYKGEAPKTYDVNSGCAVLQLTMCGTSVMLSSDLDVGQDDTRGWRSIVKHRATSLASSIVKVGHHGSETAHHPPAWHAMGLLSRPRAAVTPFPARGGALPRRAMLEIIRKEVRSLHVTAALRTASARAGKLPAKHSPFAGYIPITPKPLENTGQIRFRMRNGEHEPRVDAFAPAWEVR